MMNLKSGSFLWQPQNIPISDFNRPLIKEEKSETVIVGAGVTGALIAHALSEFGSNVIVIDSRIPGTGSTQASTALIQYEFDIPLYKLSQSIGQDSAAYVYHQSLKAVAELYSTIATLGINVSEKRVPTLNLAYTDNECEELIQEFNARTSVGFQVQLLSSTEISDRYPWQASAGLYNLDGGYLDPVKLTCALLHDAVKKGVRYYSDSRLLEFNESANGVELLIDKERKITCQRLILASGYETKNFLPSNSAKLTSSYACATAADQEVSKWKDDATVWEARDPYFYLRKTPDSRIIIGGQDKPFSNPFLRNLFLPLESFRLKKQLRKMLDNNSISFEFAWCGTFAESKDGMPFVGCLPNNKRVFAVLGSGGNGTTVAVLAKRMALEWMNSDESQLHSLFSFSREN